MQVRKACPACSGIDSVQRFSVDGYDIKSCGTCGTLFVETLPSPEDERFDIITCLDVIEHISDPKAFLSLAASLLAEEGVMVVSTPNYSGVIAKLLGARDPYMTPPEHVTFLTAAGMQRLVSVCGLKVRQFQTFGKLIPAEMDRSVQRYFPRPLYFLGPMLWPAVRFSFWALNLMKLGLEQEVYLTRISET